MHAKSFKLQHFLHQNIITIISDVLSGLYMSVF